MRSYTLRMSVLYSYKDNNIYCHHSLDAVPMPENFTMHAHDQMEIYCFFSGKGSYLVEGTSYSLYAGDVIIVRQAETHRIFISGEVPYERVAVHFSPSLIRSVDERLLDPFKDRPLGIGNYFSGTAFPQLSGIFRDLDFSSLSLERSMIISKILEFLVLLYDVSGKQDNIAFSGGYLSEMVNYVNAHLFEDISAEGMSRYFSRSVSQFGRDFLRATGSSFWKYVTIKRLMSARALLQRGESAQKAAMLSGYSDYSAFFRAYRKQFGCAPSTEPAVTEKLIRRFK